MALTVTVQVRGTQRLMQELGRLNGQAYAVAGGALFQEAEAVMATSKERVPVDMGTLRASGHVQPPKVRGTTIEVVLGYGGAASGYALFVHEGTGPAVGRPAFMPPVDVIRAWAVRHGIPADAAFVIARAIGRRGLRPTKFLEAPLREAERGMAGRIAARIRRRLTPR